MIHENIELTGSFTVSGSFVLPSHPSSSAVYETGSLYHDSVEGILKVYTGTQWVTVGEQTTPVDTSRDIEYLLVAGGAAGGGSQSWGAGGGGAGGYLSSSLASVTSGSTFTVTIGGGGGAVTNAVGTSGTDSSIAGATISTITATGGGGGGGQNSSKTDGADGGSGGGAQGAAIYATEGSGTVGQGNDGGPGADGQSFYTAGGGGGGATTAGQDASIHADKSGGNGGTGATSNITGTSVERAGGGGGGTNNGSGGSGTGGTATGGGGAGGTGSGGTNGADGTAGTANTGGGGGGAGHGTGAAGGSGVAIFAYDSGSFNCAGGIVGDAGNGRKYHQFNSSGTFKLGATSDFNNLITTNLKLHLDAGNFDSRGTSTWTDLSSNNIDGTVTNTSLPDFYYDFNGSNSRINLSSNPINGLTSITMECWFNPDATPAGDRYIVSMVNQVDGWRGVGMRYTTANKAGFVGATTGGTVYTKNSTGTLTNGDWEHVVMTSTQSELKIYINGSLDSTHSTSGFGTNNTGFFDIGMNQYLTSGGIQTSFDGKIAQVRVYNGIFTASEVLQNYNATKTNFT